MILFRHKHREFRGAHAPRVLAMAPSPSRTLPTKARLVLPDIEEEKDCCGEAPQPARGARALPGVARRIPL